MVPSLQRRLTALLPAYCAAALHATVQPPLAGAAAAWEALNIQIGAMVGSAHFGSLVALDSGGGVQLCASLGLRSRRSQQEQRAALSVAPGHVAATPAGPVEDEPEEAGGSSGGSQGSSAAGSICSKQRSEQLGGEWPHGSEQSSDGDQHAALQLPGLEQQSTAAECAGSSGAGASSDGKRGGTWDSPSEVPCSPQPGWAHLGASGAVGGAAAADADFMHPTHWAAARQAATAAAAAAVAGGGGGGGGPAHSTSTSSVAGGSGSAHSFLLPGACYSSSETSSEAGELAAFAAGFAGADALPSPAGGSSGAEQQRRAEAALTVTALASPAAAQPAPVAQLVAAGSGDASAAQAGGNADEPAATAAGAAGREEEEALPLYGRGDHLLQAARPLTLAERLQLVLRAGELFYLFAPFLLLGCFMLLLASQLEAAAARRRSRRQRAGVQAHTPAGAAAATPAAVQAADAFVQEQQQQQQQQQQGGEDEDEDVPAAASPAAQRLKTAAWRLLLRACKRAGAATVKWAQWGSTREDVFPEVNIKSSRPQSAASPCSIAGLELVPAMLCPLLGQ